MLKTSYLKGNGRTCQISNYLNNLIIQTLQTGQETTCKYPYKEVGASCYYFSSGKASWNEAYVGSIFFLSYFFFSIFETVSSIQC